MTDTCFVILLPVGYDISKNRYYKDADAAAASGPTWSYHSYAAFHWARKLVFTSFPVGNIVPLKSEKIGQIASEDVVIQLLKSKCIPVSLCSLEVCNLSKSDVQSLDFNVNRFFIKLFCTKDLSVVKCCQQMFHAELDH